MAYTKEDAVARARKDLAHRLGVNEADIQQRAVDETDFPDTSLGAGGDDEMSGQMITRGWRIQLQVNGRTYEYRADRNQVRLYNFKGKNFVI
jgi:hypothetical protein